MQDQDRIWHLIARKLNGDASEKDLMELEELLKQRPDIHYTIETLTDFWKTGSRPNKNALEQAFLKHLERMAYATQDPADSSTFRQSSLASADTSLNTKSMFKNYFTVAWRNLVRHKAFSVINITGLAIGMASAILVLVWIGNQLSFDQFHSKKERIYEFYNLAEMNGTKVAWDGTSSLLGPAIQLNYPQAEEVFRVNWVANLIFSAGEKHLEAEGYFTDPGFLKTLDFHLISGDINTALKNPESAILTESFARKLFGKEDPLGKAIKVDSNANFMVTGVMKDPPQNSRFEFEYLIPMEYRKKINWEIAKWDDYGVQTFVLLKPGVTEQMANKLFRNIVKSNAPEMKNELFVHPMRKWHLYSRFENGKPAGGNIEVVRLFAIIGAFILLIACINYMNLSTAKSEKRAKEVGIRKVIGARKTSLVWQFISESILIAFLAGCLALIIANMSIDAFNELVFSNLVIPYSNPYFWLYGIAFILVTGIVAGSYPALFLAAQKPIRVLKGVFKSANALVAPRKVLVVFQFSFAIVFMVCTIVIYRQIQYGQGRDTGMNSENLAYVYLRGNISKHYESVRSELYNSGAVESVTRTSSPITFMWVSDDSYEWPKKNPSVKTAFSLYHSDNDFAKTMGIEIINGRDINALKYPTDTMAVLVNETAVKTMGLQNPVGQYIKNSQGNWQIVGVVKDFRTGSPYHPVQPIIVQGPKNWFGTISFRLNKHKPTADNLAKVGAILKKYNPDYPSDFQFVDQDLARQFTGDKHMGKLAALFAGLAIFISCLGLYALASYMAANRIKEIGVRKVLGASITSITTLLSKDFLKLVIISIVIASPVAWWMMHSWLNNYVYRINISWWIFVLAGLLSVFIAIITISFQAIKAALANPVKALRSE